MREIKFRAWNPEMERFEWDGSVQFDGVTVSGWGADKYDWILEQFTGLRDKNGREIYEGDIVKYWYDLGPAGEYEGVASVYIGEFGVGPMEKWNYTERRARGGNWLPEVIGNIHENPELLND